MSTITQLLCNKFGGIRQKNPVFTADLITAQDLQNVELYFTEINSGIGIRTMKGNIAINDSLANTEKIINIWESTQGGIKYCFVHTETENAGKFYLYDVATNTLTLIKNLTYATGQSNGFDVSQGWDDLFFFTNGKEMFTYEIDGGNIVNMTPQDRDGRSVIGIGAVLFAGKLWIFNKNVLWWSVTANIYNFSENDPDWDTSAGYLEFEKNITAIHEYLNSLAVFHSDSSELLSIDSNNNLSRGQESPAGCASYSSLVFHDTNLYFYDDTKKSVFSFKQVVTGEKTLGENVAVEIQEELHKIDNDNLDKIKALSVFIEGRNEIWWLIPTADERYSTILIFDYLKGEWLKRKCQKINCVTVFNGKLYSGSDNGKILEEYQTDTFDGDYIKHYYKCSPFNLGAMNTLKVFLFPPRITFDMPYRNDFYVEYKKNYNLLKKPKLKHIKAKNKGLYYYGSCNYGAAYYAPRKTGEIGKFPNATFKILEIMIYTDSEDNDFCIKNIEFSKIKVKQV